MQIPIAYHIIANIFSRKFYIFYKIMYITSRKATAGRSEGNFPLKLSFNLNDISRGYVGNKTAFTTEGRRFESSFS